MNTEEKKKGNPVSRRTFIKTSLALAGGLAVGSKSALAGGGYLAKPDTNKPDSVIEGVTVGTITYSYRSMENQGARALLDMVVASGIGAVELMGDPAERFAGRPENPVDRRTLYSLWRRADRGELTSEEQQQWKKLQAQMETFRKKVADWRASVSMDKFAELGNMFRDAGVDIYAFKPSAFGQDNTDEEVHYAFNAARAMGASACTTEHPGDDAQTQRLGDIAAEHQLYMSYHAHTQATPTFWDTALEQSEYNAINLDVGHWVAAGNPDVIPFIRAKHDRIESIHMKDRTTPANGAKNLVWGEGDTPIRDILRLMRDEGYSFPATIELEYDIPEGSDAVTEVARCLEYSRAALTA